MLIRNILILVFGAIPALFAAGLCGLLLLWTIPSEPVWSAALGLLAFSGTLSLCLATIRPVNILIAAGLICGLIPLGPISFFFLIDGLYFIRDYTQVAMITPSIVAVYLLFEYGYRKIRRFQLRTPLAS